MVSILLYSNGFDGLKSDLGSNLFSYQNLVSWVGFWYLIVLKFWHQVFEKYIKYIFYFINLVKNRNYFKK